MNVAPAKGLSTGYLGDQAGDELGQLLISCESARDKLLIQHPLIKESPPILCFGGTFNIDGPVVSSSSLPS